MRKYVIRNKIRSDTYDEEYEVFIRDSITIFETENHPRPTGLLDAEGHELFAYEEREPIGFRR